MTAREAGGERRASPAARRGRRLLGWAVSLAVLGAVAVALRGRWEEVAAAGGLPGPGPLAVALAANLAGNLLLAHTWREVVALAGPRLPARTAAWVWSASQLARYTLSGAQVGGRAVLGRGAGLTAVAGGVTVVVEVAWMASLEAVLLLATLPWWLPAARGLVWLAAAGALPAAVLAWGLAAPAALLRATARVLSAGPLARWTGAGPGRALRRIRPTSADAARLTVLYAANTGLRLGAFLVLFAAVGGDLPGAGPLAAGAFAAGQFAGRVAVFAPGGIGPREGATALAVAPAVGGGPALLLVAATRLVEIAAELLFLGAARAARPGRPPAGGG